MMTLSMCSLPCGAAAAGAAGGNGRGAVSRIMNKDERYTEIDLVALLKAFWRHIWLILAAIAVLGGMAFAYARFMITPMYTASALMYVNNNSLSVGSTKVSLSYSDLSAAKSLVDTYVVILNARTTLNEVIRTSGVDYTYKEMQSMVSAGAVNSTEVVQIDVTMPDPQEAERVANTITKVLPGRIADIIDGSSARVVDTAVAPSGKASPSYTRYTALGMLLGLVLSCGFITVRELFDDRVQDEDYLLQRYTDIPMLAVIPDLNQPKHGSYGYYESAASYGGKEAAR